MRPLPSQRSRVTIGSLLGGKFPTPRIVLHPILSPVSMRVIKDLNRCQPYCHPVPWRVSVSTPDVRRGNTGGVWTRRSFGRSNRRGLRSPEVRGSSRNTVQGLVVDRGLVWVDEINKVHMSSDPVSQVLLTDFPLSSVKLSDEERMCICTVETGLSLTHTCPPVL